MEINLRYVIKRKKSFENLFMTTSFPIDLELENFGWSENLISSNSGEPCNSIVDNTMSIAIFLLICSYCLLEIIFELIFNELRINIVIPRISLFNLRDLFVLPRLTTK